MCKCDVWRVGMKTSRGHKIILWSWSYRLLRAIGHRWQELISDPSQDQEMFLTDKPSLHPPSMSALHLQKSLFLSPFYLRKSRISPRMCSPHVVRDPHLPSTLSVTILTNLFPCFKQTFPILKAHLNFHYRPTHKVYIQILSKSHWFTHIFSPHYQFSVWHFS